jgi:hypothetical protein
MIAEYVCDTFDDRSRPEHDFASVGIRGPVAIDLVDRLLQLEGRRFESPRIACALCAASDNDDLACEPIDRGDRLTVD